MARLQRNSRAKRTVYGGARKVLFIGQAASSVDCNNIFYDAAKQISSGFPYSTISCLGRVEAFFESYSGYDL